MQVHMPRPTNTTTFTHLIAATGWVYADIPVTADIQKCLTRDLGIPYEEYLVWRTTTPLVWPKTHTLTYLTLYAQELAAGMQHISKEQLKHLTQKDLSHQFSTRTYVEAQRLYIDAAHSLQALLKTYDKRTSTEDTSQAALDYLLRLVFDFLLLGNASAQDLIPWYNSQKAEEREELSSWEIALKYAHATGLPLPLSSEYDQEVLELHFDLASIDRYTEQFLMEHHEQAGKLLSTAYAFVGSTGRDASLILPKYIGTPHVLTYTPLEGLHIPLTTPVGSRDWWLHTAYSMQYQNGIWYVRNHHQGMYRSHGLGELARSVCAYLVQDTQGLPNELDQHRWHMTQELKRVLTHTAKACQTTHIPERSRSIYQPLWKNPLQIPALTSGEIQVLLAEGALRTDDLPQEFSTMRSLRFGEDVYRLSLMAKLTARAPHLIEEQSQKSDMSFAHPCLREALEPLLIWKSKNNLF